MPASQGSGRGDGSECDPRCEPTSARSGSLSSDSVDFSAPSDAADDHASMESARHQMPQRAPPADVNHGISAEPASASGVAHERPAAGCSGSSPTAPALGPAGIPDAADDHASMESARLQMPQMAPQPQRLGGACLGQWRSARAAGGGLLWPIAHRSRARPCRHDRRG